MELLVVLIMLLDYVDVVGDVFLIVIYNFC